MQLYNLVDPAIICNAYFMVISISGFEFFLCTKMSKSDMFAHKNHKL